jgi:hypothetical protein
VTWRRFRARYGGGPLHLLVLVASFAIAGAAVVGWSQRPRDLATVLEWFVAAILIHDLVLLPLYSVMDRIALGGLRPRTVRGVGAGAGAARPGLVNPTPYLRIPAILSGLLLAVFFPVIFGLGAQTELSASGIAESGYLARWLLATGVMFSASGLAYVVATARARVGDTGDGGDGGDAAVASSPQQAVSHRAAAPPSDPPAPAPPSEVPASAPRSAVPLAGPPSEGRPPAPPSPIPPPTPPSEAAAPPPAPQP